MQYLAKQKDQGKRLSVFLKEKLGEKYSLKQIKRSLDSNSCILNGQVERFASTKIRRGDRVIFKTQLQSSKEPQVLYEDLHYRIINKPAGINSESFEGFLVHRLDKGTTGALVIPKTQEAHDALREQFKARTVQKEYLTVVDGVPVNSKGVVRSKIGKKKENFWGLTPYGKEAVTEWIVHQNCGDYAILICKPKTGRTHQIRIHMCELGHPILGDYQYCRSFLSNHRPLRHLLHAWKITFYHPFREEHISIIAPLPEDFRL